MNLDMIRNSHEELENIADGLRSLGHLIQISSNSTDQIALDDLGKLLMTISVSVTQQYNHIHLGLYNKLPR